MKTAVIAVEPVIQNIEPVAKRSKSFEAYSRLVQLFQNKGLIPRSSVVSMIHSSLYLVPLSWYAENEGRYAGEAKHEIERLCKGRFNFEFIKVLRASASSNHYLVEQLSKYLNRMRSDLLVVLSSNRSGIPYWFLGSFSETAAFTSDCPVLVFKPHAKESDFSRSVRILVAIDAAASYSARERRWIIELAKSANAHIDLVYAKPPRGKIVESVRLPKDEQLGEVALASFVSDLKKAGVSTSLAVLKDSDSIAEAIVDYAEKRQSWMIVTISTQRKLARKLLLGSTARRILSLTKRPFLSLRLGKN